MASREKVELYKTEAEKLGKLAVVLDEKEHLPCGHWEIADIVEELVDGYFNEILAAHNVSHEDLDRVEAY